VSYSENPPHYMPSLPARGSSKSFRLRERLDTSKCFSRIVSELVCISLLCWTSADLRRKYAFMEDSSLTVRASSQSWKTTVVVFHLLFPTVTLPIGQRKVTIDAPWVSSSSKKDRSNHHRKCLHATPDQCSWYGILN
jgi:hypothetical protein